MISRYIKGEAYKILNSKFLIFSIVFIAVYSGFVNYLYVVSKVEGITLYKSFMEEYLLLYIVLSLFYSSFIISDEINYCTIYDLDIVKMILSKFVVLIMYILLIFIFSTVISFDISIILFKWPIINFGEIGCILKEFVFKFPMLLELNLFTIIFSLIVRKSSISLGLGYLLYISSNFINKWILLKPISIFYYMFTLNWDLNNLYSINLYVSFGESLLVNITIVILQYLMIKFLCNFRKSN